MFCLLQPAECSLSHSLSFICLCFHPLIVTVFDLTFLKPSTRTSSVPPFNTAFLDCFPEILEAGWRAQKQLGSASGTPRRLAVISAFPTEVPAPVSQRASSGATHGERAELGGAFGVSGAEHSAETRPAITHGNHSSGICPTSPGLSKPANRPENSQACCS